MYFKFMWHADFRFIIKCNISYNASFYTNYIFVLCINIVLL